MKIIGKIVSGISPYISYRSGEGIIYPFTWKREYSALWVQSEFKEIFLRIVWNRGRGEGGGRREEALKIPRNCVGLIGRGIKWTGRGLGVEYIS